MEKLNYRNENQKNNNLETFNTPKRRGSYKNLILGSCRRKTAFLKYLQYRSEKFQKRKATSKEQNSTSYIKAKNFPSINLNIISNRDKKQMETISYYNKVRDFEQTPRKEKEDIISELLHEKNESDIKNLELIELKNYYKKLQDNNLTYKIIIEKLLNIDTPNSEDDNNKDINREIKSINNIPKSIGQRKINDLKKLILNFDKTIEEKNKILYQAKQEEKAKNFINLNKLLINKNYELENLVSNSKELQYFQNDMDNRVDFFNYSIIKFKDNSHQLKRKLKKNNQEIKINEEEIENYIKEKEELIINVEKLEKEVKNIEEDNKRNKDKIQKLKIEYEKKQEINKEKVKIKNNLEEFNKLESNIKKILEKNDRKINFLEKENKEFIKDLDIIEKKKKDLNEIIKQNNKNRKIIKIYEKEIKELKEEIEKNRNVEKELIIVKEKENERIRKEIEEFEKARIGLLNKIEELNKELSLKIKLNNKKEEELNQTNKEYVDAREKKNNI